MAARLGELVTKWTRAVGDWGCRVLLAALVLAEIAFAALEENLVRSEDEEARGQLAFLVSLATCEPFGCEVGVDFEVPEAGERAGGADSGDGEDLLVEFVP